jgi:hypothetical protein
MPVTPAEIHKDAIVVVGHADIAASDVDWRRKSGERGSRKGEDLPSVTRANYDAGGVLPSG